MQRLIKLIFDRVRGKKPEPEPERGYREETLIERMKREDPAYYEWLMKRREQIERKRHGR